MRFILHISKTYLKGDHKNRGELLCYTLISVIEISKTWIKVIMTYVYLTLTLIRDREKTGGVNVSCIVTENARFLYALFSNKQAGFKMYLICDQIVKSNL